MRRRLPATGREPYGRCVARILRSQLPDGYFHVTANSVHEAPLFLDVLDRLLFLSLFRRALVRFDLRYHVYCLMGTHYHAILEGRTEDLSRAAQWYQSHYAREHNARHGRRGALFGQRFSSWVIHDEQHFEAAVEYILNNPVRRGPRPRRPQLALELRPTAERTYVPVCPRG